MHIVLFLNLLQILLTPVAERPGSEGDPLQEMKRVDIAMSALAGKVGFAEALLTYAHEDFVKLNDGEFPVVGRSAFEKKTAGRPGTKDLAWEPAGGMVAASGELGYTWGNWTYSGKDTTLYGNYFSVWKRGTDGAWKLLLDGGNNTPPPKE